MNSTTPERVFVRNSYLRPSRTYILIAFHTVCGGYSPPTRAQQGIAVRGIVYSIIFVSTNGVFCISLPTRYTFPIIRYNSPYIPKPDHPT